MRIVAIHQYVDLKLLRKTWKHFEGGRGLLNINQGSPRGGGFGQNWIVVYGGGRRSKSLTFLQMS